MIEDDAIANPAGPEETSIEGSDTTPAPPSPVVSRGGRNPIRADLWAKARDAVKAHFTEGSDNDDVVATAPEPPAAPPAPEPTKSDAPANPPPPELIDAWERNNARATELAEREKGLTERESKARDIAGSFMSDAYGTLKHLIKLGLGDDVPDSELEDEVAWQVTQLSLGLAGATVDPHNPTYYQRKLERELRQIRAERRLDSRRTAEQQAQADEHARVQGALHAIKAEFTPVASKYRWLADEGNVEDLIFDFLTAEYARSGKQLDIADAAAELDAGLERRYKKKQHLVTPQAQPTDNKAPPSGQPKRPSALTTADASEDAAPNDSKRPWSIEDHRRRVYAQHRPNLIKDD